MPDYRDDHSPDIALLLTVARAVVVLLKTAQYPGYHEAIMDICTAMAAFEHYPDPTEAREPEHV